MGNTGFEKAFINRTNAGNGITVWNWRGGVCCPAFFAISQKIFEMSERCNNSACFSVEIKGTSDICVTFVVYACGKSILGVRTHEKDTADRRQRHLYMVSAKILTAPGLPGKNGFHSERSAGRHPRGNAAGGLL